MVVELKYQYYFFSITSMLHQKIIKVKIEFWRRISQSEIRNLAAAEKSDALRAAKSVGKIPESLIVVPLPGVEPESAR